MYRDEISNDPLQMYTSDRRILLTVRGIIAVAAPCPVVIPTVVLYFIDSSRWRLAAIVLFTLGFSCLVTITTRARSAEIFAATAA